MFCTKCGKEFSGNFCPYCGTNVDGNIATRSTISKASNGGNGILILGIVAAVTGWICIGIIPAIIALIMGIVAIVKKRGNAKIYVGIVLSIVGLIFPILFGASFGSYFIETTKDEQEVKRMISEGQYDEALNYMEDKDIDDLSFYVDIYKGRGEYDKAVDKVLSYYEKSEDKALIDNYEKALKYLDALYDEAPDECKNRIDTYKKSVDDAKLRVEEKKALDEERKALEETRAEAEKAKAEADKAKEDAKDAKAEADMAKADADKAKEEAKNEKAEANKAKEDAKNAKVEADKAKKDAENEKAEANKAKEDAAKVTPKPTENPGDTPTVEFETDDYLTIPEIGKQANLDFNYKDCMRYTNEYEGEYVVLHMILGPDVASTQKQRFDAAIVNEEYNQYTNEYDYTWNWDEDFILVDKRKDNKRNWVKGDQIFVYGRFIGVEQYYTTNKYTDKKDEIMIPVIEVYYDELLSE